MPAIANGHNKYTDSSPVETRWENLSSIDVDPST